MLKVVSVAIVAVGAVVAGASAASAAESQPRPARQAPISCTLGMGRGMYDVPNGTLIEQLQPGQTLVFGGQTSGNWGYFIDNEHGQAGWVTLSQMNCS
jgi:hypothetical protein